MTDITTSTVAYLRGSSNTVTNRFAYLSGSLPGLSDQIVYLSGNIYVTNSQPAMIIGYEENKTGFIYAYCFGIDRSSIHAYMDSIIQQPGEIGMTEYSYIWLKTSNLSLQKKFRVIAQNYDDGTYEKAENLERTIGGGINHSVGANYLSWSPIIKVRQSELETDYGTTADLLSFYQLNNPNGIPSNNITFIDHHGNSHVIHISGTFQKSMLGSRIEGNQAWAVIKMTFIEVP